VLLKLLGNKTRREILRIVLAEEDAISPKDLAERLNEPLNNVTYHVRTLVGEGGLKLDRTSERRGSLKHFYVAGPLVLAHPEFVAAVLGRGGESDPA
jgi:DNA-binding transcriptional ArsR family regulator